MPTCFKFNILLIIILYYLSGNIKNLREADANHPVIDYRISLVEAKILGNKQAT